MSSFLHLFILDCDSTQGLNFWQLNGSFLQVGNTFDWECLSIGRNFEGFSLPVACLFAFSNLLDVYGIGKMCISFVGCLSYPICLQSPLYGLCEIHESF